MANGIDVSKWQGAINWAQVKADPDHIEFVLIKATEGGLATGTSDASGIAQFGEDPDFHANAAGARAVGLAIGFYHFGRPDLGNSPEAEAAWFLSRVLPILQPGDVLALDLEVQGGNYAAWSARFLAYCRANAGFEPLFYSYQSYFAAHGITFSDIGSQAGLWLAAPSVPVMAAPVAGWPFVAMQQAAGRHEAGVPSATVDFDVFNGSIDVFRKYGKPGANAMGSGSVTPAPAPAPTPAPAPAPTPAPAPAPTPDPIVKHDGPGAPGFGDPPSNGTPPPAACPTPAAPRSPQDILVALLGWLKSLMGR